MHPPASAARKKVIYCDDNAADRNTGHDRTAGYLLLPNMASKLSPAFRAILHVPVFQMPTVNAGFSTLSGAAMRHALLQRRRVPDGDRGTVPKRPLNEVEFNEPPARIAIDIDARLINLHLVRRIALLTDNCVPAAISHS